MGRAGLNLMGRVGRVDVRGFCLVVLLISALLVAVAPARAAAEAGQFLSELTERAIDRLTEPGISDEEQKRRFRSLVNEGFDIPAISRFVLGRYWRRANEVQQQAFTRVLEDLVVHRFLPAFAEIKGEKIEVGLVRPFAKNPDYFSVSSKLGRDGDESIRIDWRIRQSGGVFKIVDVVAEGVSIAVTLRSEYNSVLKRNGGDVDALTQILRDKIAGL